MTTVAPSASVRGQALVIIQRELGRIVCLNQRLEEFEGAVVGSFLADIDMHFGILLDDIDLKGTIADLVDLIEVSVALKGFVSHHVPSNIAYWDDERAARGLSLCVPPQSGASRGSLATMNHPGAAPPPDTRSGGRGCETSFPIPTEPEAWTFRAPMFPPLNARRHREIIRQVVRRETSRLWAVGLVIGSGLAGSALWGSAVLLGLA